jgi:cytochrome b561
MAYAEGFSRTQISLHWATVALVALNLVLDEGIGAAQNAYKKAAEPAFWDGWLGSFHAWTGLLILLLTLVRLALRLLHGVPAPPPGDSRDMQKIASLVVIVFYAMLLLMPATGIIAYYFQEFWVGEIHQWGKPFFLGLIALHVAAALWHHFYKRNDVLRRMLRPGPPPPEAL